MDNYLSQIPSETLQHLLTSVRCHSWPFSTDIPLFDNHIPLNRGDVIEIQGHASCGKSHFLYHFLLSCILPPPPSRGMSAILYDTDSSFDILRFCHLLSTRISELFPLVDAGKHAELKQTSLSLLHIFRPKSLPQLATSLKYLLSYHASHIPDDEIGLLAIDSMSAFYWPELLYEEQLRNFAPKKTGGKETLHRVLTAISDIIRSHAPLVLLTNWGLRTVSQEQSTRYPSTLYKQHLRQFPVVQDVTSTVQPLRLAHHVSLSLPSLAPLHPNSRHDVSGEELPYERDDIASGCRVVCLITSSGVQEMSRFQLIINGDHIQTSEIES